MNRLSPFVALLLFAACDDDAPVTLDAGTDTTSQADTATDATGDPTEGDGGADTIDPDAETDADTAPVDTTVTFRLVNENPGGLSRWVQVVDNRGTPGWYNMMPPDSLDEFLRIHDACTICNCDEPDCEECVPEPEIVEIAPGESVTAVWDGTIIDFNQDSFCEEPGQSEETQFQVEFVWSPEPPDETGALPVGTLSRTRLPFELGTDSAVTYELEALADK